MPCHIVTSREEIALDAVDEVLYRDDYLHWQNELREGLEDFRSETSHGVREDVYDVELLISKKGFKRNVNSFLLLAKYFEPK